MLFVAPEESSGFGIVIVKVVPAPRFDWTSICPHLLDRGAHGRHADPATGDARGHLRTGKTLDEDEVQPLLLPHPGERIASDETKVDGTTPERIGVDSAAVVSTAKDIGVPAIRELELELTRERLALSIQGTLDTVVHRISDEMGDDLEDRANSFHVDRRITTRQLEGDRLSEASRELLREVVDRPQDLPGRLPQTLAVHRLSSVALVPCKRRNERP